MRYIVIGAGAIGGTVGARLFEAGHQVVLVARGAHHDALSSGGLTFGTPTGIRVLAVPVVAGPADLELDEWAMQPVLGGGTAGEDLPLLCLQNGVDASWFRRHTCSPVKSAHSERREPAC